MTLIRKDLQFPDIRSEIMETFKRLSDKNLQLQNWIKPTAKHFFWDNLSSDINTLFDDSMLQDYPEPENHIRRTVVNQQELTAVFQVMKAVDKLLNTIGYEQPDSAYIDSPLWDKVVKKAQKAYKIFLYNDELYEKEINKQVLATAKE